VVILDGDDGPSAQEHAAREWDEIGRWLEETAEPVVGSRGEAAVLQALDPFWTRGIVTGEDGAPAPAPRRD
jgi:hypothetical protein